MTRGMMVVGVNSQLALIARLLSYSIERKFKCQKVKIVWQNKYLFINYKNKIFAR